MSRFAPYLLGLALLLPGLACHAQEPRDTPQASAQKVATLAPIPLANDQPVVILDVANMQTGWLLGMKQDTRFEIKKNVALAPGQQVRLLLTADKPYTLTWSDQFGEHFGFALPEAMPTADAKGRIPILALTLEYHPFTGQWDLLAKTLASPLPQPAQPETQGGR